MASGGGVASTGLELAFLCLIAINLAVLLFLRQVQGQLLQNDHALLDKEKSHSAQRGTSVAARRKELLRGVQYPLFGGCSCQGISLN